VSLSWEVRDAQLGQVAAEKGAGQSGQASAVALAHQLDSNPT